MTQKYFIAVVMYIGVINTLAFVAMGIDKSRAKAHKLRIAECRLCTYALMGGGCGGLIGMYMFRHKTKKWKFIILFWSAFIMQLSALIYLTIKL